MIDCLENLIGIHRPCGDTPASESGLYLQDLPEITIKNADNIVTDQESGLAFLQDKIAFATEYLKTDFLTRLYPRFAQNSILENQTAGFYQNNKPLNSGISGSLKGMQLKVREYPYLSLFLSSVSLFVNTTGTVPVYVYDLIQGKLLDTINVSAVAGEIVQVDIYKLYKTNGQTLNLFIGYDSTNIESYNSYIFGQGYNGCRKCPANSGRRYGNRFLWMSSKSIATSFQKIEYNLQPLNDTGGLSVIYSLNCTVDKFICSVRNQLAMPLLYLTGLKILEAAKVSQRVNSFVVIRKDEIDTLIQWYDGEYRKTMAELLQNLRLPTDICFLCNKAVRQGTIGT